MLRSILFVSLLASTAAAQAVHDTGAIRLGVSNDGSVGASAGSGTAPLVFAGQGFLFDAHLLVGTGADRLSGAAYSTADWTPGNLVVAVPGGTGNGLQTFQASFFDADAPNPLRVGVTQTSRSLASTAVPGTDRLVALAYEIRNGSDAALSGVYAGLFADLDVAGVDQAGFDAARRMAYAYTGFGPYAGQVLLGATPLSGWSVSLPGFDASDAALFHLMTTPGQVPLGADDRVTLVGTGPFTIPAGGSVLVQYALVVGNTLADLRAAADVARSQFTPDDVGPDAARGVSIGPARPNPASGRTALTFYLDAPRDVRLAVADVLGREVAVLAEGPRAAGEHTATLDASRLPAGVYVARLVAGGETAARRLTVVR